jgi:hypothetical protein
MHASALPSGSMILHSFVATNRCSKHEPSSNCALRVSDRGPHEHHLLGHDEGATPGGSCI